MFPSLRSSPTSHTLYVTQSTARYSQETADNRKHVGLKMTLYCQLCLPNIHKILQWKRKDHLQIKNTYEFEHAHMC